MGNSVDQWLCDKILNMSTMIKHKYAIAIKGAWGSGKARFVNSVLAQSLRIEQTFSSCFDVWY